MYPVLPPFCPSLPKFLSLFYCLSAPIPPLPSFPTPCSPPRPAGGFLWWLPVVLLANGLKHTNMSAATHLRLALHFLPGQTHQHTRSRNMCPDVHINLRSFTFGWTLRLAAHAETQDSLCDKDKVTFHFFSSNYAFGPIMCMWCKKR